MNDIFDNEDKGFEGDNSVNNNSFENVEAVKEVEVVQKTDVNSEQNQQFDNAHIVQEKNASSPYAERKSNKGLCIALIACAALIIGGMSIGTSVLVKNKKNDEVSIIARPTDSLKQTEATASTDTVTQTSSNKGETVADIVENVMPSIVSISCTVQQQYNFFGRDYSEDAEGSGSGIIIGQNDKQVLIATNNHVIEGASTVMITFNDEQEVKAEIKGADSSNDLAVVAVNISDMKDSTKKIIKVASLGKSEKCKVGEKAIAIGNALGYGQSVTVGVISALNREVSSEDYIMSLIQTDAAINPGNSGGALLNSKGEVIGINSVKYVSEDTEGMGYAIPITDAITVLNDLMNYEEIPEAERAYLGIVGYDIDSTFSQRSNIPVGVYIQKISKSSPATKAGLKVGDVIVKFAGKKVTTMENIQSVLKNKKSGEKAEVVVKRAKNGQYKEKKVVVTFGARGDYTN